jgi:hypothetical protein
MSEINWKPGTREELVASLKELKDSPDFGKEETHQLADQLLLTFIGDDEVQDAFDDIDKWYA